MNKVKELGMVYTPLNIVTLMLDNINYKNDILEKHIIDNSCGDGAFLKEIVDRYCKEYFRINNSYVNIEYHLEKFIHGIEIDIEEKTKCINNLNNTIKKYTLKKVNWDILCENALYVDRYNGKMDYVVGNPPYVRTHNLKNDYEKIKKMNFSKNGMTDLFIVFYEIGLNMLNDNGVLTYITPSSLINSKAGLEFRKFIIKNNFLVSYINLKHNQLFKNATTYTGIFTLSKNNKDKLVKYYEYENNNIDLVSTSYVNDFWIKDKLYFGKLNELKILKEIFEFEYYDNSKFNISVKNGLATLADSIFIKDYFDFEPSKNIISVLKGSTGKEKRIIYPYDEQGNIIKFKNLDLSVQNYFLKNKDKLINRSLHKNTYWYEFGRTQAIKDINKNKFVINNIVKEKKILN